MYFQQSKLQHTKLLNETQRTQPINPSQSSVLNTQKERSLYPTNIDTVIIRFSGEIGIKSEWTRQTYEKLLLKNIKKTLKHHNLTPEATERRPGRIYIQTQKPHETTQKLTKVFGISSISPACKTTSDIKSITKTSLETADSALEENSAFAVRCNRIGTHPYKSLDICKEIGQQILNRLKHKKPHVNLTNPQTTISIEIWNTKAYIYTQTTQGPGGFPVGSQGKLVCLLSGGIDSPVACWLAMKRGCPITPIYFDNTPLTDQTNTSKALETAKQLFEWSIGHSTKTYIIPHGKNLETCIKKAPRKYTCLLCKRLMYRIAEKIADIEQAEGIVTGEAIGEQASQTITNLKVLNQAASKYPVHRPLLGFDKTETEKIARKIGTFEISTRRAKSCSAAPNQPSVKAKLEAIKKAESQLDMKNMIKEAVKASKTLIVNLNETF